MVAPPESLGTTTSSTRTFFWRDFNKVIEEGVEFVRSRIVADYGRWLHSRICVEVDLVERPRTTPLIPVDADPVEREWGGRVSELYS